MLTPTSAKPELLPASVFLGLALALGACGGESSKQAAAPPPIPVRVATVEQRSVPVTAEAVGNVEAQASVAIKSQVDGQIAEVLVHDGQDVAKGTLLFRLDPRPFEIQLKQAQASLARDRALHAAAITQEARYADLLKQGFVTPDQYAAIKGNLDTLEAAVQTDQGAIDNASLRLEYARIRAPISGRLGKIALQQGNLVKANDTGFLVTLNQLDPVYVSFSLREQLLPEVREAMSHGAAGVEARSPQDTQPPLRGRLSFVDNAVDSSTGTIRLRATFSNSGHRLWPGQFVTVTLRLGEETDARVIPLNAVQSGPKGTYVYVVGADSRVEQRDVVISRSTADVAIVAKGLNAGERVVTDGHSRIAPGAAVVVQAQS